MHRSALTASFLVAGSLMVLTLDGAALADEKGEEYTSPDSAKQLLLKEPLHGLDTKEVTIVRVTFPPGWVGGQHFHTGPVYVYILKGDLTVREKGKEPKTIAAGTLYREPIGNPMEVRNASTSQALEALVFQIGDKGKPLMIQSKF